MHMLWYLASLVQIRIELPSRSPMPYRHMRGRSVAIISPLMPKVIPHSVNIGGRLLVVLALLLGLSWTAVLSLCTTGAFSVLLAHDTGKGHPVLRELAVNLSAVVSATVLPAFANFSLKMTYAGRLAQPARTLRNKKAKLARAEERLLLARRPDATLMAGETGCLPSSSGPNFNCRPDEYEAELIAKVAQVRSLFDGCGLPGETHVARSAPTRFRMRAKFKMWHASEAQLADGIKPLSFVMHDPVTKRPIFLNGTGEDPALYPSGSERLNELMRILVKECSSNEVLSQGLFETDLYTTLSGEALVTLIYHKDLDAKWRLAAETLKTTLGCELIGRSKGQKVVLGRSWVNELMEVDGVVLHLKLVEGAFSQPNTRVACQMASWARAAAVEGDVGVSSPAARGDDLVEMYAGSGMFSVALAPLFRNVLATEISGPATETAIENAAANNVTNLQFAPLSAEELSKALAGKMVIQRLMEMSPPLKDMDIRTVLVDPPRAGLGTEVSKIVAQFDRIIYISCNPATSRQDYDILSMTHEIQRFAVFDQFPYTDHIEMGMLLKKRPVDVA